MKTSLFLFLIFNLTVAVCFGQQASVRADANACELNSLHLDGLRNELANNPAARLVAKFYGGRTETNVVSVKRAAYIRKFLEKNKGFDPMRFEFINSGKLETTEDPKIEFHILQPGETEGTIYLVTYSRLNRTPCLDCCGGDLIPKNIGSKPKVGKKLIKKTNKSSK